MTLELGGLDGSNPLGFLAALGVLRILDEQLGTGRARLSWVPGRWRAKLTGVDHLEEVVAAVERDRVTWAGNPILELRYAKDAERGAEAEGGSAPARRGGRRKGAAPSARPEPQGSVGDADEARVIRDVKLPPACLRERLTALAEEGDRRTLELVTALVAEGAVDGTGQSKPTALHFTAGQQQFVAMLRDLQAGVDAELVREALVGPWRGASTLPNMRWDATVFRDYALRASDPSKEKPGSDPGADWLAFRGLPFHQVVAGPNRELVTTGCYGGWKGGCFRWPLWSCAASVSAVRSLLAERALLEGDGRASAKERRARGLLVVFESRILRHDNGGRGNFSPARVVA